MPHKLFANSIVQRQDSLGPQDDTEATSSSVNDILVSDERACGRGERLSAYLIEPITVQAWLSCQTGFRGGD